MFNEIQQTTGAIITKLLIVTLLSFLFTACGGGGNTENTASVTTSSITGNAQKGAFQTGASITVQELTASGENGSNNTTASVSNDLGAYSLTTDWTGWGEVTISGDFYDEYNDQSSTTPITLNSIQSITSGNITINVNLFSHFIAARIRQRVQSNSETLATAKTQAEAELQTALSLPSVASEHLDLHDGDGANSNANAALLLFSGGFMAVGNNSTLLTTLTDDFKADGAFDTANLQAIAEKTSEAGMIDRLASNLSNKGVTSPPDASDLGALPDWAIPENNAPVADDVAANTDEDTSTDITLVATDSDDDALSYIKVADPANGTVNFNGNTVTYTPTENYNGNDSFTYKVNDGTNDSNIATVSVTVNAINDKPVASAVSANTDEDTAKDITLLGTDIDGDALSYVKVTDPANGSVNISGSTATYTPAANFNGTDTFTYKVNDGTVDSDTVAVTITVGATNDAPVANAISDNTNEDTAKDIALQSTDNDGDTLSYIKVTNPANGTVSFNNNIATYIPTANYHGNDSFTYKVNDGTVDSNIATVSISVNAINDAPIANAVNTNTDEDIATDITLTGTDVDGDTLSYIVVTNPANGALSVNGNTATYTPTENYSGTDSFTYKVNDGTVDSDTVTVTITVGAVNDAPVADAVNDTTDEDTAKDITLSGTDGDGDTLSYIKVTDPANGTVSFNGNTVTYTPTENYHGNDSFTYKVNDGTDDSNTATVSITVNAVNDAPVANAVNASTDEDVATDIDLAGFDIDGDNLAFNEVSSPTNGVVSINGSVATYTPNSNYYGSDSFIYKVNDGESDSATAEVNILVNKVCDVNTSFVLGNGTTAESNTTRNVAIDNQGNIHVVYYNGDGIFVSRSIDKGHTFETPILINNTSSEPEISTNGNDIFISWVENGAALISTSFDFGFSYGPPFNAGLVNSNQVHMATDELDIYLLAQNGNDFLFSNDSGLTFEKKSIAPGEVYSDVQVDPISKDVFVQTDDPEIMYFESSDLGNTFTDAIFPGGSIFYSTSAISSGSNGRFLFVSGSGTTAFRVDLNTQTSTELVFGENTYSRGRSLAADSFGNVIDGYITDSNIHLSVSNDLGNNFGSEIIVSEDSQHLSVAIDHIKNKVIAAYTKNNQVQVNTYDCLLEPVD